MESAGRTGIRQGKVSELTLIAPFAPGGAERLRALLELRNGNFDDTDRVGTVHDMRFVFLDNDTKLLFATAYDGDWDPYIEDFAAKIPDEMDVLFSAWEGWPGIRSPEGERLDRQAPDPGRRLVRRLSGSHGAGHPPARSASVKRSTSSSTRSVIRSTHTLETHRKEKQSWQRKH